MDGVTLLQRAKAVGLRVMAEGDKLVIRGPKRAEPVAQQLIQHKPAVMAALADTKRFEVPDGWTAESWRDRLRHLADRCEPIVPDRARELREWADGVQRFHIATKPPRLPDLDPQERGRLHDLVREDLRRQGGEDAGRDSV